MSTSASFDVGAFRDLTRRVIAGEKPGFWGDWTDQQRALYAAGDWRGFSRSRGYSEAEMADYAAWLAQIDQAKRAGLDPYALIRDLTLRAALRNLARDTRGEFLLSSHEPGAARNRVLTVPELRAMLAAVMEREGRRDAEIAGLVREALAALERHAQRP
jgi:hypothetical protein